MNILITGGLGFIGSNFYNTFKKKYPDYNLVILDSGTYAADENNIEDLLIDKFPVTYTAGRRKKTDEGFEAKPATEVLIRNK
jgi:dTDP-D-glucose 4,6-dehydratase